jgi:hypothetical protein
MVITNYDLGNYRTPTDRSFANNAALRYLWALHAHLRLRSLINDMELKSTACAVKAVVPHNCPAHLHLYLVAVKPRQRIDYLCHSSEHQNLDEN